MSGVEEVVAGEVVGVVVVVGVAEEVGIEENEYLHTMFYKVHDVMIFKKMINKSLCFEFPAIV